MLLSICSFASSKYPKLSVMERGWMFHLEHLPSKNLIVSVLIILSWSSRMKSARSRKASPKLSIVGPGCDLEFRSIL